MLHMRTSNSLRIMGFALAALFMTVQARAIVAFDYAGVVGGQSDGPLVLGNRFDVNSPINVTAVGAFDSGSGSFGSATVPVAVYKLITGIGWQQVNGTLMSFTGNDGTQIGNARFQLLTSPVTLSPGNYAIIAANYGVAGTIYWNSASAGTAPSFNTDGTISMPSSVNSFYGSGATLSSLPPFNYITTPTPGYGAGTFEFTPVPEAAAFGAAGVGLLGLVYVGRYARLRRKMIPA